MPPFAPFQPLSLARPAFNLRPRRLQSNQQQPGLTEEEEQSLLSSIGTKTLSGIATVAAPLDFAGGAIRNVLTGQAPALNPFSHEGRATGRDVLQNFGLAPKNVEGFHPIDNPADAFFDVAGFATEVALDPLTYMTFGASALTKAGKVAQAAGLLGDVNRVAGTAGRRLGRITTSLDDLVKHGGDDAARRAQEAATGLGVNLADVGSQKVGGLIGVGLPFRQSTAVVGTGKAAQRAAKALDRTGDLIAGTPPVRAARTLFDSAVEGHYGKWTQKLAASIHGRRPGASIRAMEEVATAQAAMDGVRKSFDDAFGDVARGGGQTTKPIEGIPYQVGDVVQAADRGNMGFVQEVTEESAKVWFRNPETGATVIRTLPHDGLTLAHKKGTDIAGDFANMKTTEVFDRIVRMVSETSGTTESIPQAFRWILPEAQAPTGRLAEDIIGVGKAMRVANSLGWDDFLAKGGMGHLLETGGTPFAHMARFVNKHAADELEKIRLAQTSFGGAKHRTPSTAVVPAEIVDRMRLDPGTRGKQAAQHIRNEYGEFLDDMHNLSTNKELKELNIGSPEYDEFVSRYRESGEGIVAHVADLVEHLAQVPRSVIKGQLRQFTHLTTKDFFQYQRGLQMANVTMDSIHELFRHQMVAGADEGVSLTRAYTAAGMNPNTSLRHLSELTGRSADELGSLLLPLDVAQSAQAVMRVRVEPEWARVIGGAVDTATRWFKNNVTVLFPSFWARNGLSGQFVNATSGNMETVADVLNYGKQFPLAKRLASGGNLGVEELEFLREIERVGIVGPKSAFDDVSSFRGAGQGVGPGSPLRLRQNVTEAAQHVADNPNILNPQLAEGAGRIKQGAARAGGSIRRVYRTGMQIGGKVNQQVEWYNRVPMYLYLRKKGFSVEAAAKRVKELQFDYSDLSPFEKTVARRVFPFYTFSRKIAGLTLSTLLQRPGGALAQSLRLSNAGHDPDTLTPDYIAGTAAVPLTPGDTGADRFLTGFGFAHEDPLSFLGGGLQGAGLEALSRTNPLAKGPLEFATGQSFFQRGPTGGRALSDLDPVLGRTAANIFGLEEPARIPTGVEQAFSNSPLSRFGTTLRTATDTRKGILAKSVNLLTGFRVTDVPERTKDAILRDALNARMKALGAKTFERVHFNKDLLSKLPPEQRQAALELKTLNDMLAKRAREQAKTAADEF